jgi:mutator protein MutT
MKELDLTLLYLQKEDCILLALKKRGFGKGKWNGVGGKIESGESIESAVIRECQEEIGVTPEDLQKVGYLIFNEHHDGERKLMQIHVYTASDWQGEITESEEMKPEWFEAKNIPYEQMWPADKLWLPFVIEGQLIRGDFTLKENNSVEQSNLLKVPSL